MGSSCFARGNRDALPLITDYLESLDGSQAVCLKGHLCADRCSEGPLVRINGETHCGVTPEAALDLLKHRLNR